MNLFVCRGHNSGKLAIIMENRGILKTCSRKMNFWVAKNEIYPGISAENRHDIPNLL